MNIYNYLKKDHQHVSNLFKEILATKNQRERESILEDIMTELTLHAESEAKTFYAALEKYEETKELLEHARKEHKEIKEFIKTIKDIPVKDDLWLEQIGEFKHSVSHHVEEEEGEIFSRAKKVLSTEEANQLTIDMENKKKELKEKNSKS
jgi:hemerythrin superfamily protein